MPAGKRIPLATYRLQLRSDFAFADAAKIVDYLERLGITDCYASPIFQAAPQSTHGYDVCGFDRVNPCLGGRRELEAWSDRLRERGMGLLLDMVPNHMGNDLSNTWWLDVLTHGKQSRYASWFDIDWEPVHLGYRDQVLLPLLEDRYNEVLEVGKLKIIRQDNEFSLAYHDRKLPLNKTGAEAILQPLGANPAPEHVDRRLNQVNGTPGNPESFDELDRIIRAQHYRLADWRIGPEEMNYRRFFDVTELVAMRMERQEVFQATHELLFDLIRNRVITGLRVDHPDGLWNPKQYFDRLQQAGPLYVVAEKILSGEELLPKDWAVDGTTGYDFLNQLNGIYVDFDSENEINRIYEEFTGIKPEMFELLVLRCKHLVLERSFCGEVNALSHRLKALCMETPAGRGFTLPELNQAILDSAAAFPVYRTYITGETQTVSEQDRRAIEEACASALRTRPRNRAVVEFLRSLLLEAPLSEGPCGLVDFVMRFQQLTGPVMAKGLEDTAFYRYNRLLSLNEVGGEPDRFGVDPSEFHSRNLRRQKRWPHSLLATATHDTKRGEDLRARLNVLSEMPQQWDEALSRWARINSHAKTAIGLEKAPDRNDEYFSYQTILGAWAPAQKEPSTEFIDRIAACIRKSIREAKRHTSWTEPNEAYEKATDRFVRAILQPESGNAFLADLQRLLNPVSFHGWINSISQTVLKIASPGVPDFYQGTELWDFNLVDPDNRRSVDYGLRESMLIELENSTQSAGMLKELMRTWPSGRIKLFTIWRLLNLKKHCPELFSQGEYVPLKVSGENVRHVCAFARVLNSQALIVAAPRLSFTLMHEAEQLPIGAEVWQDTNVELPANLHGSYEDVFSGTTLDASSTVKVADLLDQFVCAVLVRR